MQKQYSETVYLSWLSSCHLPLKTMTELLNTFGSGSEIFSAFLYHKNELLSAGTDPKVVMVMQQNAEEKVLDEFSKVIENQAIFSLTQNNSGYPEMLKHINDPPAVLFCRGNLSAIRNTCISMVGSRNASFKGMAATEKIACELSNHGITIVSGMADGIDSAAHKGCIRGGSPTVAVMGCGPDRIYPVSNSDLYTRILDNDGLILSEYAPLEKPLGWHFPIRNRIISGLSEAVLMMECRIRSGSMTTVRHALDQGREVYAYPGETNTPWSEGSHQLLREGAGYFTCAADILDDLGCLDKHECSVQNNVCRQDSDDLNPVQQRIVNALKDGMLTFDEITARTGIDTHELFTALTVLMIKRIIKAYPGKLYELTVD